MAVSGKNGLKKGVFFMGVTSTPNVTLYPGTGRLINPVLNAGIPILSFTEARGTKY
jgi:hypothetical protein